MFRQCEGYDMDRNRLGLADPGYTYIPEFILRKFEKIKVNERFNNPHGNSAKANIVDTLSFYWLENLLFWTIYMINNSFHF